LAARGLIAWSQDVAELGVRRAKSAVNELGPELFPLIHRAEVRLTGARKLLLDRIPKELRFRVADRYEMVGVIDVITHVELDDPALKGNGLVRTIVEQLPPGLPPRFEVIIDYKGMRRPPTSTSNLGELNLWEVYGWQVHTYAHLRSSHEDSLPVVAAAIVYLNELAPTGGDLLSLMQEARSRTTDVSPAAGSEAERILRAWNGQGDAPPLPLDFRLSRALRVLEITPRSIGEALTRFDQVVAQIECCRGEEMRTGKIISSWGQNPEEQTCTACDARTYCPSWKKDSIPQLPAIRVR
jgi:hypothetical protein